ncbi:mCG4750, isoform CRA_c [Mus musculus]|nr:mCG4750, isoform CRA_c [Mus musculus]
MATMTFSDLLSSKRLLGRWDDLGLTLDLTSQKPFQPSQGFLSSAPEQGPRQPAETASCCLQ